MRTFRAIARSIIFFLKVLPILPSKFIDYLTGKPTCKHVKFTSTFGSGEGDLYCPSKKGIYPGVVVCLGVVPFGFDHPQIPRLGSALAQSGFAALLFQSPSMQEYLLNPEDIGNVAAAYQYLIEEPFVYKDKSGLLGTCVGGAFALLAAAHPSIRNNVKFVATFAPYASMHDLATEIASSTRINNDTPEPWQVDPLTKKVFVHSLTAMLEKSEADKLRSIFDNGSSVIEVTGLSRDGKAIYNLLSTSDYEETINAYNKLPTAMLNRMEAMSPISHLQDIHARLVTICHDRDDLVIPVGESRSLVNAWRNRHGLHYTEFIMFEHADPTKRKLKFYRLIWELGKFFRYVYPIFKETQRK